jgi:hypothetical protein
MTLSSTKGTKGESLRGSEMLYNIASELSDYVWEVVSEWEWLAKRNKLAHKLY